MIEIDFIQVDNMEKTRDEDFVTIWQQSNTIAEFCQAIGLRPSYAVVKASRLRRAGVALKRMGSKSPGHIARLSKLVQELNEVTE